ncbi:unnamed protein product [Schistosoma margrebowiei]|uniref:Uncharacterized protein n=1 Tax=Schistosoma margrebowiei TaxID=48269 RepID=A0A183M904_9TREM|nr:unnamed protein product [Schistosoma margrebowiei]
MGFFSLHSPSPPSVPIDSFKTPVAATSGTSVDKRNSQVSDIFQSSTSSSGHSIHGISYESPSDNKSVHSFDRTRNSLITSSVSSTLPPPLPPKKSQLHKLFCKLDDPYEVPKHATTVLVTKINTTAAAEPATSLTSSLSTSSTVTPIRSKSSITSTNELLYRKKQFNRLSLSPQLGMSYRIYLYVCMYVCACVYASLKGVVFYYLLFFLLLTIFPVGYSRT